MMEWVRFSVACCRFLACQIAEWDKDKQKKKTDRAQAERQRSEREKGRVVGGRERVLKATADSLQGPKM